MTAVSFYRRGLFSLGITIWLVIPLQGQQYSPPFSEIFLLDLGIVIEPSSGEESYNRLVNNSSKEVDIRIQKVHSGTVQTINTQKLLTAIGRVNTRLSDLETSFQSEMMAIKSENAELKQMLAAFSLPGLKKPDRPEINLAVAEPQILDDVNTDKLPVVKSIVMLPPRHLVNFDTDLYIQGMYAYQCGNFATALKCFDDLVIQTAELEKVENVLYWTADAYLQMHDYEHALEALDKLLTHKRSGLADDALIKKGLLYKELGAMDLAMNTFKKVVVGHPESEYLLLATLEIKRGEIVLQ